MELSNKLRAILKLAETYDVRHCSKCKQIKKESEFNKNQHWCKECRNEIMKKYIDSKKFIEKQCECGRIVKVLSYNAHLKSNYHKRRLELKKENSFILITAQ